MRIAGNGQRWCPVRNTPEYMHKYAGVCTAPLIVVSAGFEGEAEGAVEGLGEGEGPYKEEVGPHDELAQGAIVRS